MVTNELGNVMAGRLVPRKAQKPMVLMPSGMTVFLQPVSNLFVLVSMMALHSERES